MPMFIEQAPPPPAWLNNILPFAPWLIIFFFIWIFVFRSQKKKQRERETTGQSLEARLASMEEKLDRLLGEEEPPNREK